MAMVADLERRRPLGEAVSAEPGGHGGRAWVSVDAGRLP